MKKVVCVYGSPSQLSNILNDRAREYALTKDIEYIWKPQQPFCNEGVIGALREADAGIIDVEVYDEKIFSKLSPDCKLLVRYGVGFDAVNLKDATKYGIAVARTTAANAQSVAEMALTMILSAKRQLPKNRNCIDSGIWVRNIGSELYQKKVGILGYGAIGSRLAKILSGFEVEILVYDPYIQEKDIKEKNIRLVELKQIFCECDAISVHIPYTKQTHHLINQELLSFMKEDAVLVCTSRGNIIDEDALYKVLKEGKIQGAGLDVFAKEPLDISSPLLKLDNIILTPHASAQTVDALWNMYKKAIDICSGYFLGQEFEKGDLLNPEVFG